MCERMQKQPRRLLETEKGTSLAHRCQEKRVGFMNVEEDVDVY